MIDKSKSIDHKYKEISLWVYHLMVIVLGLSATRSIIKIPGETENIFLLGLSAERLIMLVPIWVGIIYGGKFFIRGSLDNSSVAKSSVNFIQILTKPRVFGSIMILSLLGILNGINFILWIPEITEPVTQAYYVRLEPIVIWATGLCVMTLIEAILLRYGIGLKKSIQSNRIVLYFLITFGFSIIVWLWAAHSGYGIEPVDIGIGWIPLGIPILETQILLAWGISIGFMILWSLLAKTSAVTSVWRLIRKEALVLGFLWIAAFWIWMAQPLRANWFAAEPRPPNHVFYPNSDSSVYDVTAINLLLGEGFKSRGAPFTIRPMYALALAFFHKIGGFSYEPIIWMQVAVLAVIPVGLYLIGRHLHNRFSGIMAAFLVILRERNAIILGDRISDAHAKLIMPFLPTMLGVILVVWVMVVWLKESEKRPSLPLVAGGLVGIFMLIRPEIGVLLPFVGLAALFELRKCRQEWVRWAVMASLGLVLALGPWIWRNYQLTGTIFIDLPDYRLDLVSRRYREDPIGYREPTPTPIVIKSEPTIIPEPIATSTVPEKEPLPLQNDGIKDQNENRLVGVIQYVSSNPKNLASFIFKHFMNSVVQTVQAISPTYPITYSLIHSIGHRSVDQRWLDCCSIENIDQRLPYWPKWDGELSYYSILPVGLNIALIAMGISLAWKKWKFVGLVPLFSAIGYFLINAVVRNSGGRYIIPANWVGILYYSMGLIQISQWVIGFFNKNVMELEKVNQVDFDSAFGKKSSRVTGMLIGIAVSIFFFGSLLPIAENQIPQKRTEKSSSSRIAALLKSEDTTFNENEKKRINTFLENNGLVLDGYALYPRFHKGYQMGSVWNYYQNRSYPNLDFYLSSPTDMGMVIPLVDSPGSFPHMSDVLVFACPNVPDYEALVVVLYSTEGTPIDVIWRNPMPQEFGCPLEIIE